MEDRYGLGTLSEGGGPSWPGIVRDDLALRLHTLVPDAPDTLGAVFADWDRQSSRIDAAMAAAPAHGWVPLSSLTIHLPFKPDNLYGAGANYRQHVIQLIVDHGVGGLQHLDKDARLVTATELMDRRAATGKPFVYVGARSAIAGSHDPLLVPYDYRETDWELELAVVIGRTARRVSRSQALDFVAGYTIVNDITARELVDRPDVPVMGMDWLACKSAPGFFVLGPFVTPARFVPDPQALHLRLSLNGRMMQSEGTDDMIFGVARLIEFISSYARLEPGDIIMTGSPSGNGTHYQRFLSDGDVMTGEIDGLVGRQETPCIAEPNPTTMEIA